MISNPCPPSRLPAPPPARADKIGRICLDILKDKWSPALQIRHVLLSIQVRRWEGRGVGWRRARPLLHPSLPPPFS